MGESESDRRLELEDGPRGAGPGRLEAPEPMAAWFRHRRRSKSQMENPSWLLSLVTHMAVLIAIGALASGSQAQGRLNPIVITISLIEGEDQANSSPIATTVVSGQPPKDDGSIGDLADQNTLPQGEETLPPGEETEVAETSASERAERELSEEPPRLTVRKPVVRWGRLPENFAIGGSSLNRETARTGWSTASTRGAQRSSHDEVVERFIQYDVGRLPGAAGAHALRQFQQLGPDAIPALVRGLNKAAAMRASCPVGVISSRLNTLLKQTDDSRMVRYAVENIGRGVDANAPHYRSIASLLHRLKKIFGSPASSSPSHVVQRPRKWWMPDQWQLNAPAARIGNKQQEPRLGIEPRRETTSSVRDQRESSDKRPDWRTLESLLDAPR